MKFQFYIANLMDGVIQGTHSPEIAQQFADCEDYFVVDTATGEWMQPDGVRVEVENAESHGEEG